MTSPSGKRPLIAVLSDPAGLSPMALAPLANERYDLLWLVGSVESSHRHQAAVHAAMLRKLGRVERLEGVSPAEAAEVIAGHGAQGLVTFQDDGMVWLAEIAARLGLPFHSPEVAARLVDKSAQRAALDAAGVEVPRFCVVGAGMDLADLRLATAALSFPVVLKPRSGAGSRNVVLARTVEELASALAEAASEGAGDSMLAEEYLRPPDGYADEQLAPFVSVESYVSGGHISHIAITGRFSFAEPFRETGNYIPALVSAADRAASFALTARAIDALDVTYGCLHTELKLTPDGPRLVEVNGRVGGGIPQMLARVSSIDLYGLACRLALGERVDPIEALEPDRVTYRIAVQPPMWARRVVSVEGLERVGQVPGVELIAPNRGPGQSVDWRKGFPECIFFADGTAADFDELRQVDKRLREDVVVVYE